eukprot:1655937-Prymnesium_polylepis.1
MPTIPLLRGDGGRRHTRSSSTPYALSSMTAIQRRAGCASSRWRPHSRSARSRSGSRSTRRLHTTGCASAHRASSRSIGSSS